jgi:hypothetical protein
MIKRIAIGLMLLISLSSCEVLREYEKINLNDPDMKLGARRINRFETTFHAYREAASGANGGKTGGGCGCN